MRKDIAKEWPLSFVPFHSSAHSLAKKEKRKEKERFVQPVRIDEGADHLTPPRKEKKKKSILQPSSYVIYLPFNRCRVCVCVCVVEYAVCQPPNAIEKYLIRPFYFLSRSDCVYPLCERRLSN